MSFRTIATLTMMTCSLMAASAQTGSSKPKGATLDETKLEKRTRPVQCAGNTPITLDGVMLRIEGGTAIQVVAGCKITIKNSHIAGDVALQVVDSGQATIENSIIEGGPSIQLSGSGVVTVKSSTVKGKTQKVGNGKITDLGDTIWQ